MRTIDEALGAIYNFSDFIHGSILRLSNNPTGLLIGPAGIGKSHLLADVVSNQLKGDKFSILLLGQHFTSEESPWTQILKNLLRLDCNENQLLEALNKKGEAQGERLIFIVDAINEGKGKYFWPYYINSFINDFSNYPWISLVLSVRDSYENLLISNDLISKNKITRIQHQGFNNVEYQASSFFFSQYGIEQPSIPLLNPEFHNPLFLKLFCEGLCRSGFTKVPKGCGGISSIINFFIKSIEEKLSRPDFFDFPAGQQVIKRVIDGLIEYKLANNLNEVPYEKAISIADKTLSIYSSKRRFLDALISEGVLAKNLLWRGAEESEEYVYLAYERFNDHLTTSYLLDKHLEEKSLDSIFKQGGKLSSYVTDSYNMQGILESLSIQVPERTEKELYELLDTSQRLNRNIAESFINSLLWRRVETIKESNKEYINDYILTDSQLFNKFFQMVYSISSDPDHPYNADRLHKYLMTFSMADRDELWTTYIHNQHYQGSSMSRLIDWANSDENKPYLSSQSRLLASKALSWLFTSTNIELRDSATKALVMLLENNLKTTLKLLRDFEEVNDPYIYERIFAAAYGAVLRSDKHEGLKELAEYIVEIIFKALEAYPNVLVRDYARNIVEYTLFKGCILLKDVAVIRPPYRSSFPSSFPSNDEIDTYKFDYNSNDFKDYYWGQNAILSSMTTEYGRGMCSYGDFGRYTFQSALYNWKDFDPNDLSNYACKLIFEEYGFDVEKHGRFDRQSGRGNFSRNQNTSERIGKKYQWIALYEVLARLSDNHKMLDEATLFSDEKTYIWFQGPWAPYLRNIDPTVVNSDIAKSGNLSLIFPKAPSYTEWNEPNAEWLTNNQDLPDPECFISVSDSEGNEWLALKKNLEWEEPVPIGQDKYEYPRKHLWYQLKAYLVETVELDSLLNWVNNKSFMNDLLPSSSDKYQVFSREYYWSPAYKFFNTSYYHGGGGWRKVYEKEFPHEDGVVAQVLPTSERHMWETGTGSEKKISYLAPCEVIYTKMSLQYSKKTATWLTPDGHTVCTDPSLNQESESQLLIRKDYFQKFLQDNQLSIVWTYLGEKNIYGTDPINDGLPRGLEVSGIYTLINGKITGKYWVTKD